MLLLYLNIINDKDDRDKFERLYLRYRKKMYYIAMSVLHHQQDAEDALHNTFLSIAKHIDKIGDIDTEVTALYLFRAVKNSALNIYAKKKQRLDNEITISDYSEIEHAHVCDDNLIHEASKLKFDEVVDCIESLPEHYRIVLALHFQYGYTIPQIAKTLDLKISTLKQRLVRGKKMLLTKLEEKEKKNEII